MNAMTFSPTAVPTQIAKIPRAVFHALVGKALKKLTPKTQVLSAVETLTNALIMALSVVSLDPLNAPTITLKKLV